MRNAIGILGAGMIMLGFVLLVFVGGMIDSPTCPLDKAALGGFIAVAVFACGGFFANLHERGRKNV